MIVIYAIIFINTIILFGAFIAMKKISQREKKQLLAQSKKELRKRQKINKKAEKSRKNDHKSKHTPHDRQITYKRVQAPTTLSIFDNPSETLEFFKNVSKTINSMKYREKIFFDLEQIVYVSVDAIMYLIASIKNTRRIHSLHLDCLGNVPKNGTARRIFEECGFYDYVSPYFSIRCTADRDHINITRGEEAAPELAGKICEFVHNHSNADRIDTKSLYKMVMELMANTKQHAYSNNSIMKKNWYVFVEDMPKYMSFVFLDTGAGIPNTIRTKGVIEKFKNAFSMDDAYFIASALRGEYRSETKLDYRGKGLPEVYKRASSGYITDLSIISGFGRCDIDENGNITEEKLANELIGTMLCWKLVKS